MPSLYDQAWRQGTIFNAALPLDSVILGEASGLPERRLSTHSRWVVASQDCELDQTEAAHPEPTIELRPVFTEDPPQDWGLRSYRLRLTDEDYVHSASPHTHVSAALLTALKADGAAISEITFGRRQAFTIWLGKRYDRPAVPPGLVPLAREISKVVTARRNRPQGTRVRDVLMQFDDSSRPVRYSLFAILESDADYDEVRAWLSDVSQEVPTELGVADEIEAAPPSGISFQLIQDSYSADVTQVTWRPNNPDPEGNF